MLLSRTAKHREKLPKRRGVHRSPPHPKTWRVETRPWLPRSARAIISSALVVSFGWSVSAATLAHWEFNEKAPGSVASSATNAILDASGNSRHLTAAGIPLPQYTVGAPLFGGTSALSFTSGTDRLQTELIEPFNFGHNDSFTLEAVVRTAPGATFTGNVVGRDWGSGLPSWWFRLENGFPRFFLEGGGVSAITSATPVNDGDWHHVAAVRDTVNRKIRVYVDHVLAGEGTDTLTTPPTNAQSLVVGAYNNGQRQFEGDIDFVRISLDALGSADFVLPTLAITDLRPADGATFVSAEGGIGFTVFSQHGVDPSGIQMMLNGTNGSGSMAVVGTPNRRSVRFAGLVADARYTVTIAVTDLENNRIERTFHFDTYEGHTVPVYVRGESGYHTYRIPALLVTAPGTLLAFAEARKNSASDAGDIDLVVKRSSDDGLTWSTMTIIWSDGANTIGNPCPVVDRNTGTIWLPFCRNNDRVFVTKSTDDGLTWADPVEVTSTTKLSTWGWYATGPGVGIQLEKGPNKGRMVIPCDNTETVGTNKVGNSHVVYSDDHGATWELGGVITPKVNECQVVELADGQLLMNMRNADHSQDYRALSSSTDGGMTWSAVTHDPTLIEPICQASFLRYTLASHYGKNRVLFSNPASPSSRINLTVRLSYDEGQTWPVARSLHAGAAAYSCLTVLPDMSIGCLYEAGVSSPYETITFSRFGVAWLTDGADKVKLRTAQLQQGVGSQAVLSWPAEYAGAAVEAASQLGEETLWEVVAAEQTLQGEWLQVVLDTTSNQSFFRLVWTNAQVFQSSPTSPELR